MVDRIRLLLDARELSTTQFADTIEVSRPVISHILSGRNKPSLEVVQKILAAFPDLSMAWLLNGTEPMLTDGTLAEPPAAPPTVAPVVAAPPVVVSAPDTPNPRPAPASAPAPAAQPFRAPAAAAAPKAAPAAKSSPTTAPARPFIKKFDRQQVKPTVSSAEDADVDALVAPASRPEVAPPASAPVAPQPEPAAATTASTAPAGPVSAADMAASPFAVPGKTIRRIVIFYHDGSFADFQPE